MGVRGIGGGGGPEKEDGNCRERMGREGETAAQRLKEKMVGRLREGGVGSCRVGR